MKVHNPNNLPTIPIADLLPSQGDLKDLTEQNYNKLKGRIEKRGFRIPVYVWEDGDELKLLDGHQRQRVLTKEGWNEPIPYLKINADDYTEAMELLLEITSQYATITQEGLDEFIAKKQLNEAEVYSATSYDALGFNKDEPEPEVEEDEAPEVSSEPPVSELGSIYQLGRHRVMCGDSTVKENVDILLNGKTPFMVLTDPPYGMNLDTDYSKRNTPGKKDYNGLGTKYGTRGKYSAVIGDDKDYDPSHIFEHFADVKEMFLRGADYYSDLIPKRTEGSWYSCDKRVGIEEIKFTASEFELCWSKKKHLREIIRVRWFGAHGTQTQDEKKRSHPTQKPIEVNTFFIQKFSKDKDDIMIDLFLGTGSCLIACEQTDRICYGMELDPKYVDVIRKRYAKFTAPDDQLPDNWQELTPAIART